MWSHISVLILNESDFCRIMTKACTLVVKSCCGSSVLFLFPPRFRYKYSYMEEMLGNIAGCRQVFERWTEWEPEEQAWHSYINFELRYKEVDKARSIYERYILLMGSA